MYIEKKKLNRKSTVEVINYHCNVSKCTLYYTMYEYSHLQNKQTYFFLILFNNNNHPRLINAVKTTNAKKKNIFSFLSIAIKCVHFSSKKKKKNICEQMKQIGLFKLDGNAKKIFKESHLKRK